MRSRSSKGSSSLCRSFSRRKGLPWVVLLAAMEGWGVIAVVMVVVEEGKG
jgi:hypothetical protein